MANNEIERWLDDCDEVKNIPPERGGPGFNKWELDFIDSTREQFEEQRRLTDKQCDKLRELWDKI
ncbi:hypothetical protein LCGC14_2453670 [marine sediment metagenome]|uniref:Uncharacterized protein n=1 Tax=marine sediment metagenome TaxID=412755 RepID=A0A0F9BFC4_9ZZZZ